MARRTAIAAVLVTLAGTPSVAAPAMPDPAASSPDKMAYWSEQRRGANGGPTRLRPERFQAAAASGTASMLMDG